MNLGTTIIGIICVALCAMPFVLTNISKKKKEKKLLASLKNLANQNDSKITQFEICNHYAIGIDETKKTVSFIFRTEDILKTKFINLATIKSCKTIKTNNLSSKNTQTIDKLNLSFSYVDKNIPDDNLEFYNSEISYQPYNELESIEKWNKLINKILNSKKQSKAA